MVRLQENAAVCLTFAEVELVERIRSQLQEILLYRHNIYGHILVIDGVIQHVEAWSDMYHEPLVHLPASFVPEIETALILGGGSLFAAHEMLKYPTLRKLVLVDHDREVVELMARFYKHAREVVGNPKFQFESVDAITYIADSESKFDLVVNDCFDSISASKSTGRNIFKLMFDQTSLKGICSDTTYRNIFEEDINFVAETLLSEDYATEIGVISIPEYPGVLHIQMIWGRNILPSQTVENLVQRKHMSGEFDLELTFFDPTHRGFFLYVPPYLKTRLFNSKKYNSA